MSVFRQRLPANPSQAVTDTLLLSAEERHRSRSIYITASQQTVQLQMPRGTVLVDGDLLLNAEGHCLRVIAKPEPVLTVRGQTTQDLLRAAYHLGNRHVPLEITATYLRLSADAVLQGMLEQLGGVSVTSELVPFIPEAGAYGNSHG